MTFRERLGLRQSADDFLKGENNKLQRLRAEGFERQAEGNLLVLKSLGFETRIDKNGNEVLSRSASNKNVYNQYTEEEIEYTKKNDLWTLKDARKALEEQQRQEEDEDEDEDEDEGEDYDDLIDQFDILTTFYDIAMMLVELHNEIAKESELIGIHEAIEILKQTRGGNDELDNYRNIARAHLRELEDYERAFRDDYNDLY